MLERSLPVNPDVIAEKIYGIQFIPIAGLKQFVHSEAYLTGSLDEIDYDPSGLDVRIRFSVAHELGHRVLHEKQIKALKTDSFDNWKSMIQEMPGGVWGRVEWQAREFAGRLLVPRQSLIASLLRIKPQIETAKNQVKNLELPALNEYIAPIICKDFRVSDDVISKRLESEEINALNT